MRLGDFEHQAFLDGVTPEPDFFKRQDAFVRRDHREESEGSEIDSQDRNPETGHRPHRSEHSAISPQRQKEFDLAVELALWKQVEVRIGHHVDPAEGSNRPLVRARPLFDGSERAFGSWPANVDDNSESHSDTCRRFQRSRATTKSARARRTPVFSPSPSRALWDSRTSARARAHAAST